MEPELVDGAASSAQALLHGVQLELGKRLSVLEQCIQQVAGGQEPEGRDSACEGSSPSTSAQQEAAQQEAVLQQALRGAAERIRDFQRRAEHQAQQVQVEGALAELKEQHAAQQARLTAQLESSEQGRHELQQQAAVLQTARDAAEEEAVAWQRRESEAQLQLEAATAKHDRDAEGYQQALAAEQQAAAVLAAQLAEAQAESAALADRLRLEAAATAAEAAEQAARQLESAAAARQQEVAALQAVHLQQQRTWEGQLEALRLQGAEARQQAAAHAAKASSAELRLADLELHARRLGLELSAVQQDRSELGAAMQAAELRNAGLAAELQETRTAADAAQRQLRQELECAAGKLRVLECELQAAEGAHSHQLERLHGELVAAAAGHEATLTNLQFVQQAAAEREQHAAATAAARIEQLAQELSVQVQQVGLLTSQLKELKAAHDEELNTAVRKEEAATASAALLHGQLLEASQGTEMALHELIQVQLGCEAHVQLLQHSYEQQLQAAAQQAAAALAQQRDEAASASAAREAELQQQLSDAAALLQRQCQQSRETAAADVAACGERWGELCSQLTEQMQQLTEDISVHQQPFPTDDAVLALPEDPECPAPSSSDSSVCGDGTTAALFATVAAVLQDGLQHLRLAAFRLRSRHSDALAQQAALQAQVAALKQQLVQDAQAGQQQLEAELAQRDAAWEQRCLERSVEVESSWRARLTAREEQLQAKVEQLTCLLETSQRTKQQLEQQCVDSAAELAAAQHSSAAALQAATAQAAQQQTTTLRNAAQAAEAASVRLAAVDAERRRELEVALAELGQQQAAALQAAAERQQEQLDAAEQRYLLASKQHQQSLEEARQAWEHQLAAEVAHQAGLHAEERAAAASKHERQLQELQARHGSKAVLLRESIASLEERERQLLTAQAVLQARGGELEMAAQAAADTAAAQAEEARLAACAAAVQAEAGFQAQVASLERERSRLQELVAELQGRLGREARPLTWPALQHWRPRRQTCSNSWLLQTSATSACDESCCCEKIRTTRPSLRVERRQR